MELFIKRFSELSNAELYEILKARAAVFVVEQNCVYNDLDGKDENAVHIWYAEKGALCAYLRVCEKDGEKGVAHIGRVLTVRRGEGLGAAILKEGIRAAFERMGVKEIYLEAQTYARGLYAKYVDEGPSFVPTYRKLLYTTPIASVEDTAMVAGIDLTQKEFWEGSLMSYAKNVDEFERLVNKLYKAN